MENLQDLKISVNFRGFALHYESPESAESWENFVWLARKKLNKEAHYLKKITGVKLYTNWSKIRLFL